MNWLILGVVPKKNKRAERLPCAFLSRYLDISSSNGKTKTPDQNIVVLCEDPVHNGITKIIYNYITG